MTKSILVTIFILLIFGCSPSENSKTRNFELIVSDFEKQLQRDLKDDNIGGSISVAIIKEDKIVWSKALGWSDQENKILADTSTIYRTGSISKSFTAFLMMQLVEEGLIKVNDPIELYLPEIRELKGYSDSTKITFLQLSTHMSGLIREPELEGAASGPIENWESKIIQSIPKTSFENRPGEQFNYSNIGYGILGLSLSRAAKRPFVELVKDKIFIPLKMNNSYFQIPNDKTARFAKGMDGGPFGEIDVETPRIEHAGRGYKVPNGGIYSTPNDLAKFMISNMGYRALLKPETLNLMQTGKSSAGDSYGLGFFISGGNGITIIEHSGSVSGYTAQLAFDRDSKYGVVIMRNYNWGTTDLSLRSHILLRDLNKLKKNNLD
ncbi:MAG: serine hydrolase domain-containing protein [Chryseolinea sp.]